jgi:hypothetical protein
MGMSGNKSNQRYSWLKERVLLIVLLSPAIPFWQIALCFLCKNYLNPSGIENSQCRYGWYVLAAKRKLKQIPAESAICICSV